MEPRQKKNLMIKIAIIAIVVAMVSIYMFTMRASGASSVGGGDDDAVVPSVYTISFYVDDIKIEQSENKGVDTVLPSPKKARNFFVGWYLEKELENLYNPSESNSNRSFPVYAKFKMMEDAIQDFMLAQAGRVFISEEYIFKYILSDGSVIIENSSPFDHLIGEEIFSCIISYNLVSEDGDIYLGSLKNMTNVKYLAELDYAKLDYNELGKFVAAEMPALDFETVNIGDVLPVHAQEAVRYYIEDIASAIEKLIHHIANLEGNDYKF